MNDMIICIGRQYGSGGREVGEKLAKRLGVICYDKLLLKQAAKEGGVSLGEVERQDEKPVSASAFLSGNVFADSASIGGTFYSQSQLVYDAEKKAILDAAAKGGCVIIGRCADYVLDGTEGLIRVFLYADIKVREERVRERNLYADKDVLKNIHRIDRERRDYNRYYAGRDWEKPENYDLLINTTQIGVDGAVQLIKDYLKMRGLL